MVVYLSGHHRDLQVQGHVPLGARARPPDRPAAAGDALRQADCRRRAARPGAVAAAVARRDARDGPHHRRSRGADRPRRGVGRLKMKVLLDTHIWLWSLVEPERLTPTVADVLAAPDTERWLSPLSIWETL